MGRDLFKGLDQKLESICGEPDIKGVIFSQRSGLSIASKNMDPALAGYSASLFSKSQQLSKNGEKPIVIIEGQDDTVLIKANDQYLLTVRKRG
ncbi:unnamed protein product [Blepharisma stoltei]|uniref:Late endosomal/lysosomal adaptor and MAPK and MTOR activator 5 n=1 Tax=Blepharisma stoltei TaxID=1481888 RepID=A0AAU9JK95_9CILI|nr:unnamed protein product [Blepharisma stoltei]